MSTAVMVVIALIIAAVAAVVLLARRRARTRRLRGRFGPEYDRAVQRHGGRAAEGKASTEELRQAMVHNRALFEDLLSVPVQRTAPDDAVQGPASGAPGEGVRRGADGEAARVPGPRAGEPGDGRTGRDDERTTRS
ncbi:hypothetical protein F8568_043650 [Actinomadura sp. LD22]|uniref:Secreted protein n=1 Tax=Actinomadura physcomitrii TaxID=2650748 RepID=A0A6I4MQ32_9ACTN|nr:hypothetical protein [Actinomadura physcomitrii]MWA05295.1 hypothetical protein [Actinomadura physcomitrii]MWA07120.1 hypothetical protein [Actinomadura physcomitrii]